MTVHGCLLSDAYSNISKSSNVSQDIGSSSNMDGYDMNTQTFGTSLTDTGNTNEYNDNNVHGPITKIMDHTDGGYQVSNIKSKSNIEQKIIEYRLYLEQISNEYQYVSAQLKLFHKQIESITSPLDFIQSQADSATQQNSIEGYNYTNNIGSLKPSVHRPRVDNLFNDMLNKFGRFFSSGHGNDQYDMTFLNVLFAFFLVIIGYILASRQTHR